MARIYATKPLSDAFGVDWFAAAWVKPGREVALAGVFVSARVRVRGEKVRAKPAVQAIVARSGDRGLNCGRLLITRVNLCGSGQIRPAVLLESGAGRSYRSATYAS
jgi:hypothetical protein